MESFACNLNVKDLDMADRHVLEHVLGQSLHEDQQLIVKVVTPQKSHSEPAKVAKIGELPEWCRLYEGMSDEEIAAFERTVLARADMTREFD